MIIKGTKIIAVDFDGVLCESKYPEIGTKNVRVINYLLREKMEGSKLILWTCRTGEPLENAIDWCEANGLVFDAVNENLPEVIEKYNGDTRKICADEYIDDKSNNNFNLPFVGDGDIGNPEDIKYEIDIIVKLFQNFGSDEFKKHCPNFYIDKELNDRVIELFSSISELLDDPVNDIALRTIHDRGDIWIYSGRDIDKSIYQCKRRSSLFRYVYDNGDITYTDIDRYICVDDNNPLEPYSSVFVNTVLDKLYEIKFPYFPVKNMVYCESLTNPVTGYDDAFGILYMINTHDKSRIIIDKYFEEIDDEYVEISKEQFVDMKNFRNNETNLLESTSNIIQNKPTEV